MEEPLGENLGPAVITEEGVPEAPLPPEQSTAMGPVEEAEPPDQLADMVGEVPTPDEGKIDFAEGVEDAADRLIEEAPWVSYLRDLDVGGLPLAQRIIALIGNINEGDLSEIVNLLHTDLVQLGPEQRAAPNRGGRPGRRAERTWRRIRVYARTQELYRRNPSRLAELVLNNNIGDLLEEGGRPDPPVEAVPYYQDLWGTAQPCRLDLPITVQDDRDVPFITLGEVKAKIRRLKAGGAPGPDGVTKSGVLKYRGIAEVLTALFNVALFGEVYPSPWKVHRTTLIPKRGKDPSRPENWRPITIAPLLARLFSGLVETRLSHFTTLSTAQRGFRPGLGCHTNCVVLDELIRLGKKAKLVGVLLDVAKAFHTVTHEAIQVALRQQRVPPLLCRLVHKMYDGASTRLGSFGVDVAIRRGVKQGDPLSPLLFNLVLDPLLKQLQETEYGFRLGEGRLAAMAYADDVAIFSPSEESMNRMLNLASDYLDSAGITLSVRK